MTQQGDVLLYQSNDDGDITVSAGLVAMSGGLETAAYMSLFGGNEQDDGRTDNPLQWWGNYGEPPERQQRSETQYLLRSLPAVPVNMRRVADAVKRDLAWLGADVAVEVSMPGLNRIRIVVSINVRGEEKTIEFLENWKADL